ncbi:hypothetical protein FKM82_002892 [Ascaphus truei]
MYPCNREKPPSEGLASQCSGVTYGRGALLGSHAQYVTCCSLQGIRLTAHPPSLVALTGLCYIQGQFLHPRSTQPQSGGYYTEAAGR